ncbi:MAG: SLBB domain-containing protein [Thiogranum sp.]
MKTRDCNDTTAVNIGRKACLAIRSRVHSWALCFLSLTLTLTVLAPTASSQTNALGLPDDRNPVPSTFITQSGFDAATGTGITSTTTTSSEQSEETESESESDSTDTQTEEETATTQPAAAAINYLQAGDTLIIEYTLPEDSESEDTLHYILDQRLFSLDKGGILKLPVIGSVPLAGLSESQAAERLQAEPLLREAELSILRLPVLPQGADALQPFGSGLFSSVNIASQYDPAAGLPIPEDYVVGPGDTIKVQLFGKNTNEYDLEITPRGAVNFPELGSIQVAGETFAKVKEDLQKYIKKRLIGVSADISMGELRSITVYVVGDVVMQGSYTLSSLSTVGTALVASGGIKPEGSLRNIQLKRGGKLVTSFDLYKLLLNGNKDADRRLHSDDVIFVPPVGATVSIAGEVIRPAIYELRGENTIGEIIRMAGGLKPEASLAAARLQRVKGNKRTIIDVNLGSKQQLAMKVQPGDLLIVPTIPELVEDAVTLKGHVKYPDAYQWNPGMRLTDLIRSSKDLLPHADLNYVVIVRMQAETGKITVLSSNLRKALRGGPSAPDNILLQADDRVFVFRDDITVDRQALLQPVLDELRNQARAGTPAGIVRIGGMVRAPGEYPLTENMRLSDLIHASASLQESAFTLSAELSRFQLSDNGEREVVHSRIDLNKALGGHPDFDLRLQPNDHLVIKQVPAWETGRLAEIRGEVRFPGVYPIARGEQLSSLIERAGGLTDMAFREGSIFLRKELAEQEQEHLDRLTARLEAASANAALNKLNNPSQDETLGVASQMISELKTMKAVGRLVINLPRILESTGDGRRSRYDITLQDGDALYIPPVTQQVTVLGEIFHPTSHVWEPGMGRDDYINLSGGLTQKSDDGRIYVIRANGAVLSASHFKGTRWDWDDEDEDDYGYVASSKAAGLIRPGDTIIVPLEPDRLRPLELWTSVSQIFFQIGVTIAQLNRSFD